LIKLKVPNLKLDEWLAEKIKWIKNGWRNWWWGLSS